MKKPAPTAAQPSPQPNAELYAALFVPDFALQAVLRQQPEQHALAVALIAEKTPKARILQCTAQACAAGVECGMTPAQGLARCSQLLIKTACAAAERDARAVLVESALNLSPWVEDSAPGICTLRWSPGFDGQYPAPELAIKRLAALQLAARLGIAPNPDLALLTAQSTTKVHWRQVADARDLAALPVGLLKPSPPLLRILEKWGIATLGELTALGREALAERLGGEALALFEQAAGRQQRPLRCVPPPQSFEENHEFEAAIETLEPLLFILRRFLEQLAMRLECVWLVAAQIDLRLGLATGEFYERAFQVPSPTREVELLFRMLHTHLEGFRAEQPIVSLRLRAIASRPARQQFALFESALRDPNHFFETLARLGALLGDQAVGSPLLESTHRPDAFRLGPVRFGAAGFAPGVGVKNPGHPALGLALRRFRPPLPARVRLAAAPGARPIFLQSAPCNGPLVAADGPILISGNWWDGAPWNRREWDVQLAAGELCRLSEENGQWSLEGVYD